MESVKGAAQAKLLAERRIPSRKGRAFSFLAQKPVLRQMAISIEA
jgi:hypothetical protein